MAYIRKTEKKKKIIDRKKEGHGLRCWARNWPKQWIFEVENGCTFRYGNIVIFVKSLIFTTRISDEKLLDPP